MLRNNTYGIEKEEQPMKNLGKGWKWYAIIQKFSAIKSM
jgi:hypothetical protein